jgi:hypothetical protein
LGATPTSRTIYAGQSAVYTININRDNYANKVTLSASNLPANTTASFNPNPTTGKSSTLTLTTTANTPAGTYQIKVGGSASGISIAPINVTLIVNPAPITLAAIPTTQSVIAGQSVSYDLQIKRTNYDGPITLSVEGLPSGVTVSFKPNPIYGNTGTMRVYSHLLPFVSNRFAFHIIATARDFTTTVPLIYMVNCGIHWLDQFGSNQGDHARDVVVDSSGNVYVVGDTFDPAQNTFDVWVAKYDSSGQQEWFTPFATNVEDRATEVAVDSMGNVFVGGYTFGTFPNNVSQGGFDFWIAKYDSTGIQQWVKQSGTVAEDGSGGFEIRREIILFSNTILDCCVLVYPTRL